MSYENQELTEHTHHTKPVRGCEFCQADKEIKAQLKAWEIIQRAFADM